MPVKIQLFALLLGGILILPSQTRKSSNTPPAGREQEAFTVVAKLEEGMRLAALKADAGWWSAYLADAYTDTDFQGKVYNKTQTLEMLRSGDLNYETMNLSDRTVRTFNGDTVIITGKMTVEGKYHGQALAGDFQLTRIWIKMGLEWKLAASQETRIASS